MKYITVNLLGEAAPRPSALALPAGVDLDAGLIAVVIVGGIVAFGVPQLATWGVERFLNEPATAQIEAMKNEVGRSKIGSQQLVERQKELEGLEGDLRSLQGLIGPGGTWAGVLEELRAITPTDLWLTDVKTEGQHIEVSGAALDYKAVAYFYTNFQNSRNFAGPVMGSVSEDAAAQGAGGRNIVRFTIRASIIAPGVTGS